MQATFWDERARKYDDDIRRHDALYTKTVAGTKSLLTSSDVVLDLGCGSGEIGVNIARHVQRVHGIDLSAKMIELANQKVRDRNLPNAVFEEEDVFSDRLVETSYSAVIALNVLHLVDDIPQVVARLHRLLDSEGVLISQTPCLGERKWLVRALVNLAQWVGLAPPIRSLTTSELESLVSAGGFEILESEIWDDKDAVQRVVARKSA